MKARWENSRQAVLLFSIPICITTQWPAEESWCRSTGCLRCSSTMSILTMTRAVRNKIRTPTRAEESNTHTPGETVSMALETLCYSGLNVNVTRAGGPDPSVLSKSQRGCPRSLAFGGRGWQLPILPPVHSPKVGIPTGISCPSAGLGPQEAPGACGVFRGVIVCDGPKTWSMSALTCYRQLPQLPQNPSGF